MNYSFCHNKDIKNRTISENEHAFAFLTNIPIVPGHVLICPKRCIRTIDELSNKEWKSIWELVKVLKKALRKAFGCEAFNYALNEGKVAGQNVEHVHFHLLPRKEGDTGITEYDPRKFLYRPGSRQKSPEQELIEVTRIIKRFIE
jgi:histidine triad (HIT) family protein